MQRQQLRAQVWPHLTLAYSTVERSFYAINQGTGPARITAMRVTVDGVTVKEWAAVEKAAGLLDGEGFVKSWLSKVVLSPGKDFPILWPNDNEQNRAKFMQLLPGGKHALSITVCYCSVLDDCWDVTLGAEPDDRAGSRDSCPILAAERFAE